MTADVPPQPVTPAEADARADVAESPVSSEQAPEPRCVSCGAIRSGPFCGQCGQRVPAGRHTLRSLVFGGMARVLGIDGGFLQTAIGLTVSPDRVVNDYLAGRTVRYMHPFAYLVITFAAFALIGEVLTLNVSGGGASNRGMTALVVPFVAASSRLVFLRGRFNYAEHLILTMYVFAQIALLLAALQFLVPLLDVAALRVLLICAMAAGASYFVWAYSRVFRERPFLAAFGALIALWGGIVLWAGALAIFVRIAQR